MRKDLPLPPAHRTAVQPDRSALATSGTSCPNSHQLIVLVALTMAAVGALTGCEDNRVPNCETRLEHQRTEHRREIAALQAELRQQDLETQGLTGDFSGAVLIWGGTAAALFVAVVMLARERRCRRVLERLLQMALHRLAGPPDGGDRT
jgi:hypothetical protein